jgi:hypothetical protein
LKYTSDVLKSDLEVVVASIKQNSEALFFVSQDLKKNNELVHLLNLESLETQEKLKLWLSNELFESADLLPF